ncbi:hypothetical protein SDC9_112687 [bioreactor metagenome]|uniref:Uncharacterized protein n=1 Tax=bioreactor metagenome TaxID=1076179 RepID=A0A645BKA1_9ZZZZ
MIFIIENTFTPESVPVVIERGVRISGFEIKFKGIEKMSVPQLSHVVHKKCLVACRVTVLHVTYITVGRIMQKIERKVTLFILDKAVTQCPVDIGIIPGTERNISFFQAERDLSHYIGWFWNSNFQRRRGSACPRRITGIGLLDCRLWNGRQRIYLIGILKRWIELTFQFHLTTQQRVLLLSKNSG